MKTIVLLLSACILLSSPALAQDEKPVSAADPDKASEAPASEFKEPLNKNVFQFSPAHLVESQFKIGYERFMGKNPNSIMLLAGVILQEKGADTRNGASGELHFRISVLHQRWRNTSINLFTGPLFKYKYIEKNEEKYPFPDTVMVNSNIRTATGGVMAGLAFTIVDKISFNFYIGAAAKYSESSDDSEDNEIFDAAYTGIIPEAGFLFGYKF